MMRVVILTARLDTLPLVFLSCAQNRKIETVGVLEDTGAVINRKQYLRSRFRKALRTGVLGPLVYRRWFVPVTTGLAMGDGRLICQQLGYPLVRVPSVNSVAAQQALGAWTFDVALSLGNRYIASSTLQAIGKPLLNIHHGKVPEFRGGPPIFWEVYAGLGSVGYTIHLVDEGLDSGPVVGEGDVSISYHATLRRTLKATWLQLMPRSMEHLIDIVENIDSALLHQKPQPEGIRSLRTTPSLWQILQAEWRVRQRVRGDGRP